MKFYYISVFIGSSLAILLNYFFERTYPNEYQIFTNYITNSFVGVSYNCIYFYSKCQLFFRKYIATNKFYLKVKELIKTNSKKNGLEVLFVKNNFIYNIPVDFPDFIITSNLSINPIYKRITDSENYQDLVFEESNIKFMLIEFKVGDNLYKINLKTDKYNYYMVDNKFTKEFFIFYINEYILTKKSQYDINKCDRYVLKMIDHDVNNVEIEFTDKNESIILKKNGYKLTIANHLNNK